MSDRLDQSEELLVSAARYAESANEKVDRLATVQQGQESTLRAILDERQETRQQADRLEQLTQGIYQQQANAQTLIATQQQLIQDLHQQQVTTQDIVTTQQQQIQGLHQQQSATQGLIATQQQQIGNLQAMMATQQQQAGNLQEILAATQYQHMGELQAQVEDYRRGHTAALSRLDASLDRLMDRLDRLEAA
jgi:chromosome segregation ATPase